jgi:hypothetical protein
MPSSTTDVTAMGCASRWIEPRLPARDRVSGDLAFVIDIVEQIAKQNVPGATMLMRVR